MNRNKTFIGMALLIAVLTLGIGYANINNINLNITGSASATPDQANFSVKFDKSQKPNVTTTPSDKSIVANGTIDDMNELAAKINVSGMKTTGDTATVTYTIKNFSKELGASLAPGKITNSNPTYFEVTPKLASSSIAAGKSTTVTVTVKLIKTPIGEQTANITVPITATATEA